MGNLFRWVALASLLALGATMANTTYAQGSKHIDLDDDAPQTATDPPPQNPDADNDNALPVSYAKRPLTLPAPARFRGR